MRGFCVYLVLALLIISGYSCKVRNTFSHMNYLNDSVTSDERVVVDSVKVLLEPGDRLSIVVTALNPAAAQQFNGGGTSLSSDVPDRNLSSGAKSSTTGITYLIDNEGNIKFPQIGIVAAKGLTARELGDKLEARLTKYLQVPLVTVSLVNFKVNVLGEVNSPGIVSVPDGKITILEAIAQCGDLTVNALRENILVVRQRDGKREFGRIDISSNKIFMSPYFYLKQGDVVYVAMNKNKLLNADAYVNQRFRMASLIFASISITILLLNTFKVIK